MPTEVVATPRAEQQIAGLSRKQSRAFGDFLDHLAAGGSSGPGETGAVPSAPTSASAPRRPATPDPSRTGRRSPA